MPVQEYPPIERSTKQLVEEVKTLPINSQLYTLNSEPTMAPKEKLICLCKQVSESEIKGLLRKHPDYEISEIKLATGASTSCGRCAQELNHYIAQHKPKLPTKQLKLF
jgi:bacterioferritin-associated ferredoxin